MDPALWSWLLHFALRCNHRDMMDAGRAIQPLLESSLDLYRELIEREGLECEWQQKGMLFAYRSKDQMNAYAATDRLLGDSFHCPAQGTTAMPCSSSSPHSSLAWPAAGTITTTPTCVPTGSCVRGAKSSQSAV